MGGSKRKLGSEGLQREGWEIRVFYEPIRASQMVIVVKNLPANAGNKRCRLEPCREDALEEGTAAHSSTLAWRIPWTEEPGGL